MYCLTGTADEFPLISHGRLVHEAYVSFTPRQRHNIYANSGCAAIESLFCRHAQNMRRTSFAVITALPDILAAGTDIYYYFILFHYARMTVA